MFKKFLSLFLILIPINAFALIEVDITRGNLDPLPIAVSPLHVDVNSQKLQDIKIKELGENISKIKKSSYNKQRYQFILQDTKNRIDTEISNTWSTYQSSKSVLEATKAQLKAAEIANEGISLEYDSGNTRTTLELIQSRSLLLDARIAFAKSERDLIISQFELANQLGSLSIKSIK